MARLERRRRFWFALALVTATILLVVSFGLPLQQYIGMANDWAIGIMNAHPVLGPAVFLLFSAISAMFAFASSTVLVPSAISAWGQPITFVLLWGGWIAGAVVAYGIGRLARPLLDSLGYEKKLVKYQQFTSKRMKFWAVVLFCAAVPSEVPGYLFGGMRYPLSKFIAAIALVEWAYAGGVIVAGESLASKDFSPFFAILGLLAVIAIGAGLLLRSLKRKKKGGLGGDE